MTLFQLLEKMKNDFEKDPINIYKSDSSAQYRHDEHSSLDKTCKVYKTLYSCIYVATIAKRNALIEDIYIKIPDKKNIELRAQIHELQRRITQYETTFSIVNNLLITKVPTDSTQAIIETLVPLVLYEDCKDFEEGGQRVYFYKNRIQQNKIAVKLFSVQESGRKMAISEFTNMLKCCSSKYVVTPLRLAYNENKLAFAMDYGGIPMDKYWVNWDLNYNSAIGVFIELARGLKFIHENNIYHGDIKPQNVLVEVQKDGPIYRYIDFGAAVIFSSSGKFYQTRKTCVNYMKAFTLAYLAPEAAFPLVNEIKFTEDARFDMLDIYSLCLTVYSMITKHMLEEKESKKKNVANAVRYKLFVNDIRLQLEKAFYEANMPTPKDLVELLIKGISHNPRNRPTINEIIENLEFLKPKS